MSLAADVHRFQMTRAVPKDAAAVQHRHVVYALQRPALTRKISMSARPKTSAGPAPRQSLAALRPIITDKTAPEFGTTIDIQSGLETFKFPTPSPHLPPRSATLPESLSPRQTGTPNIGLAIGSPSELFGQNIIAEPLAQAIIQHPPRMSSLQPLDPFHFVPRGRIESEDALAKQRKSGWRGIGSMFRKSSKATTPPLEDKPDMLGARKDSLLSASPEQNMQVEERVTALPQLYESPRPMSRGRTNSHIITQSKAIPGLRSGRSSVNPLRGNGSNYPNAQYGDAVTFLPCTRISESPPNIKRRDSPMSVDKLSTHTTESATSQSDMEKMEKKQNTGPTREPLVARSRTSLWERRRSRLLSLAEIDASRRFDEPVQGLSPPKTSVRQRRITSPTTLRMPSLSIQTEEIPIINATGLAPRTSYAAVPSRRPNSSPMKLVSPVTADFARLRPATPPPSDQSFLLNPSPLGSPISPLSPKHRRDSSEPTNDMPSPKTTRISIDRYASRHQSLASPIDLDQHILEISVAKKVTVTTAWAQMPRTVDVGRPLRARVIDLGKGRKASAATIS